MTNPISLESKLSNTEWQILLLLAAINFTHTMDFVMVIPMGPKLIKELHISANEVGHIISSYTLCAAIFGLLGASIIDKIERKKALLISFLGLILGTFLCAWSSNYIELLIARGFAGASGGIMSSMVYTYVGDYIVEQKRGRATGIVMNSYSIASILGIPLGLMLANQFNWNSPFYYLSILGLFLLILSFFILPKIDSSPINKTASKIYTELLSNNNALWALLFMVLLTISGFAVIPFISTFVVSNAGLPENYLMYMYLISGIINFFAGPATGKLADKFGKNIIFSYTALLSAIPVVIFSYLNNASIPYIFTITTLMFLLFATRYVPAMAMITSSIDKDKRGGFLTISNSVQQLMMGVSTYIVGLFIISNPDGTISGFSIGAFISAIAVIISVAIAKKIKIIS
ncbi:MAG: MFS transporter [Cytophagales bacterium]|nr:MAG: MFS transporter [Cytophagales bacterium]